MDSLVDVIGIVIAIDVNFLFQFKAERNGFEWLTCT